MRNFSYVAFLKFKIFKSQDLFIPACLTVFFGNCSNNSARITDCNRVVRYIFNNHTSAADNNIIANGNSGHNLNFRIEPYIITEFYFGTVKNNRIMVGKEIFSDFDIIPIITSKWSNDTKFFFCLNSFV